MLSLRSIELYTQPACPPCEIVKQFLQHHHVSYKEFDVSKAASARKRMTTELESYSTPTIRVDQEIIRGFDLQALEKLLNIG